MIQLTTYVDDIDAVMSVFTHIRVYTSAEENGVYVYLDDMVLVGGQSTYEYIHMAGTDSTWYRSSYWSAATESSLSDPVRGAAAELYHYPTYPSEVVFGDAEKAIIRKIRRLIGDHKDIERLYLIDETLILNLKEDNKTIELNDKGWPVYITLDDVEKTNSRDPQVQGYKYLTFSGTLDTSSNTVEIWYYVFKFSDREVYEAYEDAMFPISLPTVCITEDYIILQAAIDLLENMAARDVVDDGATIKDDQSSYDPSAGLRERKGLIQNLQKRLDILIERCISSGLLNMEAILID